MADATTVKYEANLTRARIRFIYLALEQFQPSHRAAQRWIDTACAEFFEHAKVELKNGQIVSRGMDKAEALEVVKLQISRDTVLAIKYVFTILISGSPERKMLPASRMERREYLEILGDIGPEGKLRRLVEKEAKLPEVEDAGDDAIDVLDGKEDDKDLK